MNSKASSQTTDTVVAEWQTSCETHGPAILSQTLRSVLSFRQHKQASTQREKTREKHVGCQYSSMLCFHMYKPRTNLKQTLFKPQIYGAGPGHQARQDLKESSINFFFACGNCRFPPLPRIEV